MYSQVLAGR